MENIISCECNVIRGDVYRITMLTDSMVRVEYEEQGIFEDHATQTVVNRNFPEVEYSKREEDGWIVVETDKIILRYNGKEPSSQGLNVTLKETGFLWNYGSYQDNLWGTARTLDEADGYVILQPGLFGRNGFSFHDDSTAVLIGDGKNMVVRPVPETDIYIFAFGNRYLEGLKAFYKLCGKTPMIPRYALGNWWSRFHRYTEESYLTLVDQFEKEEIPISVGVIDMDWHLTSVDPKYGTGWTGYTFDPELFPDPQRFLSKLHDKGLYTTLNVHPADGIRAFECMYEDMAKMMGIDPKTEEPIVFDMTDPKYREAFFTCVNHMYEDMGVDFWWLDWQQGNKSRIDGLDPLWLLNHYYYEDMKESGRRPMIFSRYAGVGSHRYPIGFSGDTFTTYRSLHFQPHFTLTSSNIGYGWWSHDICGHMHGDRNLAMMIRWLQFGVFSPIMRLHSSANPFFIKEPWNLPMEHRMIMGDWMRLRHRLIPYIYTMTYRAHKDDIPLVEPLYYEHPTDEASYDVYNEYYFGSQLLVSPITEEESDTLQMASSDTLLPEGKYYDIFTGKAYEGRLRHKMYRSQESIPVFLPAGGILPLDLRGKNADYPVENKTSNPDGFEILLGAGACGSFTLYEDDSLTNEFENGKFVETRYELNYNEKENIHTFTVNKAEGDTSLISSSREYMLTVYGVTESEIEVSGASCQDLIWDNAKHTLTIKIGAVDTEAGCQINISGLCIYKTNVEKELFNILKNAKMDYDEKERIYYKLKEVSDWESLHRMLEEYPCDEKLKDAIEEILVGEK